ncbi:MAG: hypothetical protein VKJ64_06540 [Leptolyngbyaceae bacterium]|nr:hypothetical protein [Leptolyngbyaceae bacterium]
MATKTSAAEKSAQSNTQEPSGAASTSPVDGDRMVRLLMTLLEVEGSEVKKGDVTKKLPRSGKNKERSADYGSVIQDVMDKQLLCEDGGKWHLERSGLEGLLLEYLLEYLNQPNCPGFISGAGKTKVLLQLLQKQTISATTAMNGNGKVDVLEPISTYEEFKQVAMDTFDQIKRDYNFERLVPIYRIRRAIGERVSRSQFSEWLFEMQAEDIFELLEQGVEDNAPDKIQDSVTTSMGKLRCYAKRIDVA